MNQLGMGAGLAGQLKQSIDPEVLAHYKAKMMADPVGGMSYMAQTMPRGAAGVDLRSKVLNDTAVRDAIAKAGRMENIAINRAIQGAPVEAVPPAMMGIDEDMGVLNEVPFGDEVPGMPGVYVQPGANSVYDPKTGEYLGEYEFMPQNGLLYR